MIAPNFVQDDPTLLGEALGVDSCAVELLQEERNRVVEILIEDLERDFHALVARFGVVTAATFGREPVQLELVVVLRPLEEHVLGHVSEPRFRRIEPGARPNAQDDGRDRARNGLVDDTQSTKPETA